MTCWLVLFSLVATLTVGNAEEKNRFATEVQPYVENYCVKCHNSDSAKGELDLTRFRSDRDISDHFRRWNNIVDFIRTGEMPPQDAKQPLLAENTAVTSAIQGILLTAARKNAGDPGFVPPRRLSNTEYDRSVQALTGVQIQPTYDFPADPAGGEGFDNTGEALRMSPNLVKKYLVAAERVAHHLVLKPSGLSFAPFPITSYNERKKLAEQAIIDFYQEHTVDVSDYLNAAWQFRFRHAEAQAVTIAEWAEAGGLSAKYLSLVWDTLNPTVEPQGYLKELQQVWDAMPAPQGTSEQSRNFQALQSCVEFGRRILAPPQQPLIRSNAGNWPISHLDFRAKTAVARDKFDRQRLKNYTLLNLGQIPAPNPKDPPKTVSAFIRIDPAFSTGTNYVIVKRGLFSLANHLPNNEADEKQHHKVQTLRSILEQADPEGVAKLKFGQHPEGGEIDPEWFVIQAPAVLEIPLPGALQQQLQGKNLLLPCQLDPDHSQQGSVFIHTAWKSPPTDRRSPQVKHLIFGESETAAGLSGSATVFCNTFPNRFFYVDEHRGLAAGFHLVEGFFRDDLPLVNKVLTEENITELNRLWQELDFITQSAETLLRGFVWFERSEREILHDKRFHFLRAEDPDLIKVELLDRFEKLYLDKNGVQRVGDTLQAQMPDSRYEMIHDFFAQIRQGLSKHRELTKLAEQQGLHDIEKLAERAFRRPLLTTDQDFLSSLYAKLKTEGQAPEEAFRSVLTAILMSPHFCFRYHETQPGKDIHNLSNLDLASRLSFFLWSSLPDEELRQAAADDMLQDDKALIWQTKRMLKNPRINAFAREFFGQWLRYRDYLVNDPIDATAFPDYDDELRVSMFEEPERLVTYLIQNDHPITRLLNSDETFVNANLAKHYGGEIEKQYQIKRGAHQIQQPWKRVTGLRAAGRGGLLGMAVILTKNSSGARTSPVKRGFWNVHHLLGQHFPPPPADVPELPNSETGAPQTIRELLAAHVTDAQCALCHQHFDSLGLALEGFDPLGRPRSKDAAGRLIDDVAKLPNGEVGQGLPGLIGYIEQYRLQDFRQTLCRKFLGYALGRSVLLSDQPLLEEMEKGLEKNNYRFSTLFEIVVLSSQFRTQRGPEYVLSR